MIPGPIDLADDVLEALRSPVIPHYGDAWVHRYSAVRQNLLAIGESAGDAFVLVGSGTVASDAAIGSSVATGDSVIVVDNGFFSARQQGIAEGYGATVHALATERGRPVTPDELRACMREHPDARVVVLSHCETATGVVNDLEQLAGVVAEQNGLLIIDAVSSFGAVRTAVDAWGVGICCTASQKALEAPPGLAPVIVNPATWEFLDSQAPLHHGMYSDLRTWRDYAAKWADFHPHPATMAVNIMYALQVSTDGLLAEGLAARYARFERVGRHVRERLRSLGYHPLADEAWASPTITAARPPEGLDADAVVAAVLERANTRIGGGVGDLQGQVFRLGHMGLAATDAYLDPVFDVLAELVQTPMASPCH